jgi:hypothetical protein
MRKVLVTPTAAAVVAVGTAAQTAKGFTAGCRQRYRRELVRPVSHRNEIRQLENEALL